MPFEILEPIAAGIIVALLNKFIINYDYAEHGCCGLTPTTESETHQIFKNLASREKELIKYVQSGHQSLCKNEKSKWYMTVGRFLMM